MTSILYLYIDRTPAQGINFSCARGSPTEFAAVENRFAACRWKFRAATRECLSGEPPEKIPQRADCLPMVMRASRGHVETG